MPCSASVPESRNRGVYLGLNPSGRRALGYLAGLLLLLINTIAPASGDQDQPGFTILEVTTHSRKMLRLVDAQIDFNFSTDAREALENGVAFTLFVDLEVRQQGRLWDTTIKSVRTGRRIQIHALSKHYRVKNLYTGRTNTYRSLADMLANIGTITDLPLIDERELDPKGQYQLRMRALLDIESLPSPLRPLAYVSSAWQLSSDWRTWPLNP